MVETTVSATAVRRLAVAAQSYSGRYRRATDSSVEAAIRRLSCVQLDSISTVERSHRIALTSRIGNYPRESVSHLLGQGRIFEYWAHEACLLPIESWPLFRRAMTNGGRDWYSNVNDVKAAHPQLADEILGRIREDGPLASRQFEGAAGGGMWNWKPAKAMLERLWNHGELVISGRQGFQRVYDLTERVIPRAQLEAPVPPADEVLKTFAEQAVRARGVLTEAGIAEHWRLRGGTARFRPARRGARRRRPPPPAPCRRWRPRRPRLCRRGARPPCPARHGTALALRQPALGPPLRATDPRLRPPDRGVQAGSPAAVRLLRAPVLARRPSNTNRTKAPGGGDYHCAEHMRVALDPPREVRPAADHSSLPLNKGNWVAGCVG